jgi:AcrR family transcriptional regulator
MSLYEDTHEDLRVRRTRMMIENAFLELVSEGGFGSMTIQEIADRAMINRATFYRHFEDKYALFEYAMHNLFSRMLESKLPADFDYCSGSLEILLSTVCDFLVQVEGHCAPQERGNLPPFNEKIVDLIKGIMLEWFQASDAPKAAESPELIADTAGWAIYGAASHWSKSKPRSETSEAFAGRAAPLIIGIFSMVRTA